MLKRIINCNLKSILISGLWDALLELRIKLQRATVTANCLPTTDVPENDELHEVMEESEGDFLAVK